MVDLYLGIIIGLVIGLLLGAVGLKMLTKNQASDVDFGEFKNQLDELKKDFSEVSKDISLERGSFKEMLRNMQSSKTQFENVARELKNTLVSGGNQKQGQWGEMLLSYILENKLGMTKGEEFETQTGYEDEDGNLQKPDVIVHLPSGRDIVIDSKVSLKDWDEFTNATDEGVKASAKAAHVESLKRHIRNLSSKNYSNIPGIKTLDAVIMFVPNEQAVSSLGKESRDITDFALEKKITVVGPSMIYYLLKSVDQLWKSERQKNNIMQIIKIATALYEKGVDVYNSAADAIKSIKSTDDKIQNVMNKIKDGRSSLLKDLEKMRKIGGLTSKKDLPMDVKSEISDDQDISKIPVIDPDDDDPPPAAAASGR